MYSNSNIKDKILFHTTQEQIYLHYLGLTDFPKGMRVSNPFTDKDTNPSLHFYYDKQVLKYKGHNESSRCGDVFQFVADIKQMDCKSDFLKVCNSIATDMNLLLESHENPNKTANNNKKGALQIHNTGIAKTETIPKILNVEKRPFTKLDLAYWKEKYGVDEDFLVKYKIYSIASYCWSGKKPIYTKNGSVAFAIELDGQIKLYIPNQPDIGVKKKVLPAFKSGIFGLEQLGTEKKESIIICAGEKDTVIANSRGFNAITFGSESGHPKPELIEALQRRCTHLFVCYDNDEAGEKGRSALIKRFPEIIALQLPANENIKGYDVADYFEEHTAADFQKIIDLAVKNKSVGNPKKYSQYQLPDEIKEPIENYISDIENFQMFMANNQIWIMKKNENTYSFYSVSNFEISILQHLQDERFPIKLIRLKNTKNYERVFDVPADAINTLTKLDNVLSNQGNYRFYGKLSDFNLIKRFLLEKMGTGKKIEVLGWQEKGNFWAWNNKINLCNGKTLSINEYGCFVYQGQSYYMPSANKFNEDNEHQYETQKKFVFVKSTNSAKTFISKVIEVQGENGISAILFTIASLFSDIIFNKAGGFPILFLYGQHGSGKTQLAKCCQTFFGKPQDALNLENGTSTKVAHIRELSQFKNSISHLAEYKPGNRELDGTLKGIFDRNGYKRGVKDSNRGTDSVPIESTAILTGNYYPNDEALISRLIWLEIQKNEHSKESKDKYHELTELIENGVSSFSDDFLIKRHLFESDFYGLYKNYTLSLPEKIGTNISRLAQNLSILLSTFKIFENDNIFPFTENEIIEHFKKITELQISKLKSADTLTKWWDCFLICFKLHNENGMSSNVDFRLDGNIISFQLSNVYAKIQRQWFLQYRENIPSFSTISEAIKRSKCYIETKNVRIKTGGFPVSSFIINLDETGILNEFLEYYNYSISNNT